jgi:hypothetical protein
VSIPLEPRTDGGAHPAPRRQGIDCTEAGDLIPALALGPIEPAERLLLLAHCENCPECTERLDRSRATVAYLPFAMRLSSPSEGAKSALFARIAKSPSAAAPVVSATAAHYSAIVDSPVGKRGPVRDLPNSSIAVDPAATSPSFAWLNSQVAKIGAPLALALVIVGLYAFNPFGSDKGDPANGQVASLEQATLVSSDVNSQPTATPNQGSANEQPSDPPSVAQTANSSTQDDSSIDTAVNLDGFTTQLLSSPPLYTLSARSNGSPTESARSIAPSEGTCRMSSYKEGQYQLSLSGVALPGGAGEAGIYLKAKDGKKTLIAKINIDANGNGQTTFTLLRPITDFSMLMIGPIEGGSMAARSLNGSMTFSLTSADQLSTFEAATT